MFAHRQHWCHHSVRHNPWETLLWFPKIFIFTYVPASDLYTPGTQNSNGPFSASCRRNFAPPLQQSCLTTNLGDGEAELSSGQSSRRKGEDTRTRTEKPSRPGTSPPFPTSLRTSDIDREPEKYSCTSPLISARALWVSLACHLKIRSNSSAQKSDDSTNMARLYLILCQRYSEMSLPLHKYLNL